MRRLLLSLIVLLWGCASTQPEVDYTPVLEYRHFVRFRGASPRFGTGQLADGGGAVRDATVLPSPRVSRDDNNWDRR